MHETILHKKNFTSHIEIWTLPNSNNIITAIAKTMQSEFMPSSIINPLTQENAILRMLLTTQKNFKPFETNI